MCNTKDNSSKPQILINKTSALKAKDIPKIIDADGNPLLLKSTTLLCRCGKSKNMPFCDGSHISTGFKDA